MVVFVVFVHCPALPVPNVPCGVERGVQYSGEGSSDFCVPNAPCGVERKLLPKLAIVFPIRFLMYRMELKERLELSNDIILLHEASIREFIVGVDFRNSFWF